nr:TPA_asm: hypothetical protein HUJ06_008534 [Nelumbo nucifera]
MKTSFLIFWVFLGALGVARVCNGGVLKRNFYRYNCPQAEEIVKSITWRRVEASPELAAKLLRMYFHDCFVRGCDASVLLDTVGSETSEKDAPPNLSLAGFDVIDEIKFQIEQICPRTVSCADILALATRDSVSYQFQRPMWSVLTGRRDGNVSLASEVLSNLASPFANFNQLQQLFASKGLNTKDLVVLSGAHTLGVSHCSIISNRLYNFDGQGNPDPSLNPAYADFLRTQCPNPADPSTVVEMDPQSSLNFDNHYFAIVNQNMGLFQSDAALLTDPVSAMTVQSLQNANTFFSEFTKSLTKMGNIGVLTGNEGEIRTQCRVVNSS